MDRRDVLIVFALGGTWGAMLTILDVLDTVPGWMAAALAFTAAMTSVVIMKVRAELPPAPALRIRVPKLSVMREATHPVPPDLRKTVRLKVPRAQRMTWRERRAWRKEHPIRIPVPPVPAGAQ